MMACTWQEVIEGGTERHAVMPDVPTPVHMWPMIRWILDVPSAQPIAEWTGLTGRVRAQLEEFGRQLPEEADRAVFVCAEPLLLTAVQFFILIPLACTAVIGSLRRLEHHTRLIFPSNVPPPAVPGTLPLGCLGFLGVTVKIAGLLAYASTSW